jgi:anti-anti-sigma factor
MRVVNNPSGNVLEISGVLDINQAHELRDSLLRHSANSDHLRLDLSAVEACDTAGLQVLLAARRHSESLSKTFHLTAVSEPVLKMVSALGVTLGEIG